MMKQHRSVFFFLVGTAVLLSWRCGSDTSAIVQQEVAARTAAYVNREMALCRDQILEDAGHMADSMLLVRAQDALRDSLGKRPNRPLPPTPLEPLDSLPVKPLFSN